MKKLTIISIIILSLFSCTTLLENTGQIIPPQLTGLIDLIENNPKSDEVITNWIKNSIDGPIVNGSAVTFIYYNPDIKKGTKVSLLSNIGLKEKDLFFNRVKNSNVFFKTFNLQNIDSLVYQFIIHSGKKVKRVLDPGNKNIVYERRIKNIIRLPDSPNSTIQMYQNLKPVGPNLKRSIYVCLPPGYFRNETKNYPVLYMHDAQQLFDSEKSNHGGWKVDTILQELVNTGKIEPLIIVGIENTKHRNEEFIGYSAYYNMPEYKNKETTRNDILKYTDGYVNFLTKQVKPFIDGMYRTKSDRDNTAIAGSSFGAGISLYTGFSNSGIFSMVGAFSGGNYDTNDKSRGSKNFFNVYPYLTEQIIPNIDGMKVYLDCGGRDVDEIFLPKTKDMYKALLNMGYVEGENLYYQIDENAGHNERSWAGRFPQFLEFMFKKQN